MREQMFLLLGVQPRGMHEHHCTCITASGQSLSVLFNLLSKFIHSHTAYASFTLHLYRFDLVSPADCRASFNNINIPKYCCLILPHRQPDPLSFLPLLIHHYSQAVQRSHLDRSIFFLILSYDTSGRQ